MPPLLLNQCRLVLCILGLCWPHFTVATDSFLSNKQFGTYDYFYVWSTVVGYGWCINSYNCPLRPDENHMFLCTQIVFEWRNWQVPTWNRAVLITAILPKYKLVYAAWAHPAKFQKIWDFWLNTEGDVSLTLLSKLDIWLVQFSQDFSIFCTNVFGAGQGCE